MEYLSRNGGKRDGSTVVGVVAASNNLRYHSYYYFMYDKVNKLRRDKNGKGNI